MPRSKRKVGHSLSTEPDHVTTVVVIGLGVINALFLPVLGLSYPPFGEFLSRSVGLHWCIVLFAGMLALMTLFIGVSVHRVQKPVVIGLLGVAATIVPLLPWFDGCCSIYRAASSEEGQISWPSVLTFPLLTLAGHVATSVAVESNRQLLMRKYRPTSNLPKK